MGLEVGEGAAVAGYWIWAWGGRIGGGGAEGCDEGWAGAGDGNKPYQETRSLSHTQQPLSHHPTNPSAALNLLIHHHHHLKAFTPQTGFQKSAQNENRKKKK